MDISKLKNEVSGTSVKDSSQVSKSKDLKEKNPTQSIKGTEEGGLAGSSLEKVSWSPEAGLFAGGMEAVKNSADVRTDRVAELKAAVKNGSYRVDSKAVAEKMLESELQEKIASRKSS